MLGKNLCSPLLFSMSECGLPLMRCLGEMGAGKNQRTHFPQRSFQQNLNR